MIINIWDFYIEEQIRLRLKRLYDEYTDWWIDPSNPLRRQSPVFLSVPDFRADTILYVHRDHARWWIDLFNEAAVFLEERARLFPDRHDEYKQACRERESAEVRREEAEAQEQQRRKRLHEQERATTAGVPL